MDTDEIKTLKAQIRKDVRAKRRMLNAAEIAESSEKVCEKIAGMEAFKKAELMLAYMPARNELDVSFIINKARSSGKMAAFPFCIENGGLRLFVPDTPDCFVKGSYGILEPDISRSGEVQPEDLDLIIVPAIAFTKEGNRLGQGGGYYDRLLIKTKAVTVGVGYDFQLFGELPVEPHDCRLNYVITPSHDFICKK